MTGYTTVNAFISKYSLDVVFLDNSRSRLFENDRDTWYPLGKVKLSDALVKEMRWLDSHSRTCLSGYYSAYRAKTATLHPFSPTFDRRTRIGKRDYATILGVARRGVGIVELLEGETKT